MGKHLEIPTAKFWPSNIWVINLLTIKVRLLVLWMIHLLVLFLYFTTKTHFQHQHQQKTPKKCCFGSQDIRQLFLSSKTLGFRIRVSSDVNTLCLKCRIGIRLLHHWSYIHVASDQRTPSCWRLSGSCNSMITQLFRSWWNTKFLWTIGNLFKNRQNSFSTNLQLYYQHISFCFFNHRVII